jgi:riboflavin synthase
MFTGIIEEIGTIRSIAPLGDGRAFTISAERVLADLGIGDSIAIDGVCHTVIAHAERTFDVQSVATTLARTALGTYETGRRVNLERALAAGQRFGGHFVQGHVDAVGEVVAVTARGEHVLIDFTLPPIVEEVTILHGSLALNGISLTVNALPEAGRAQVSIIPHTWEATALRDLSPGSPVNLEGDMIGKYVHQLLRRPADGGTIHPADAGPPRR